MLPPLNLLLLALLGLLLLFFRRRTGLALIEAPSGFPTVRPPGVLNYLPFSRGLELSRAVLYEVVGLGWYHVRLASRGKPGQQ